MRIEMACFTDDGRRLGERLAKALEADGDVVRLERCGGDRPVRRWTAERFRDADALVFIGAAGIAVRALAPELVSKTSDPAAVAIDDAGRFAIALLSGHIGGANALAERIAALVGATPVVTTATDARGLFAVDAWAVRNGLAIVNPEGVKRVSAKLLAGKTVKIRSAFPVAGPLPDGFVPADGDCDVIVDIRRPANPDALCLVPPVAVLGMGCRRGVDAETVEKAFAAFCEGAGIFSQAFAKACSVDLKAEEKGLIEFCRRRGLRFETFSAAALARVEGDFAASSFVASVAGVDNVCERSAVLGAGGRLVAGKTALDGVTLAAAAGECEISFRGNAPARRTDIPRSDSMAPEDIEKRSFAMITEELAAMRVEVPDETAFIVKRVIHTTADFDYARALRFSDGAVAAGMAALRDGAAVVTDTQMARAGINARALAALGGAVHCHIADADVAEAARGAGCTRSRAAVDKAAGLYPDGVYVVGNAPTALLRICELMESGRLSPRLVIGAPVGFVNVIESKELLARRDVPFIVAEGRKGGSNVAAAICNALVYRAGTL